MRAQSRADPPLWDSQRHVLLRLRRQIEHELDTSIHLPAGAVVVDFGCGDMPYRALFEGRGARYVGCDIDQAAPVAVAPGSPVPLPSGSAAAVVSFQVLEHVWDLDWYLGECRRLLSPGAPLLLSTHGAWLYHPHPTDFRRWTRDGLVAEIESRGFKVDCITGIVGPLAWTTQFRLLGYREVLRRIPVIRSTLLPLLTVFMNLRMELEDAVTPTAIKQDNASVYVVVAHSSTA